MKINSEEIKRLRIEHGLTLKDVAVRIGVSEATVSRYENETVRKVSPSVMLGYSKLFNVPINALYENAQTEWVSALEEAGLRDPRVAGFIEYLEEQAQKESTDEISLTPEETQMILAYRDADDKTRQIVNFALNVPKLMGNGNDLTLTVNMPIPQPHREGDDNA